MKPHIWLETTELIEFDPLLHDGEKWTWTVRNWRCQVDGDAICGGGANPRQAYLFWLHSKHAEARIAINRMEREIRRLTA